MTAGGANARDAVGHRDYILRELHKVQLPCRVDAHAAIFLFMPR